LSNKVTKLLPSPGCEQAGADQKCFWSKERKPVCDSLIRIQLWEWTTALPTRKHFLRASVSRPPIDHVAHFIEYLIGASCAQLKSFAQSSALPGAGVQSWERRPYFVIAAQE